MSSEEQLVTCVCHTRGFIQTYFLSIFEGYLKKQLQAATISLPKKKGLLKLSIL